MDILKIFNGGSTKSAATKQPTEIVSPPPPKPQTQRSEVAVPAITDAALVPANSTNNQVILDEGLRQAEIANENLRTQNLRLREQNRLAKEAAELEEQRKGDEARSKMRAYIEQLKEKNRLAQEKAATDAKAAAERVALEAKRPPTWEEINKVHYNPEKTLMLTPHFIQILIKCGGLEDLFARKALEMEPFAVTWDKAHAARVTLNRSAVVAKINSAINENAALLASGTSAPPKEVPSLEEYERTAVITRQTCATAQRAAAVGARPIVLEVAVALQNAARKLSGEVEFRERAIAAEFGVQFFPSPILFFVIAAGFDLCKRVERSFLPSPMSSPRAALFGLLDASKKGQPA